MAYSEGQRKRGGLCCSFGDSGYSCRRFAPCALAQLRPDQLGLPFFPANTQMEQNAEQERSKFSSHPHGRIQGEPLKPLCRYYLEFGKA